MFTVEKMEAPDQIVVVIFEYLDRNRLTFNLQQKILFPLILFKQMIAFTV